MNREEATLVVGLDLQGWGSGCYPYRVIGRFNDLPFPGIPRRDLGSA